MASRMSESVDLVERCRRAGWNTVRGAKGWKVYPPDSGKPYSVHLTYSDVKSLTNATRDLENMGLKDHEAAQKNQRLTENRSRADIAREAAERRGKALAAASSLAKAAGPYLTGAEDIDLDWYVTPHPAPWMRWGKITPHIARYILEHHNGDNRPLDKGAVRWYRDVILAGLWHLTHQGLAFDTRGMLQDGQHRLHALLAAAEIDPELDGLPFAVFVGMPEENFKAIDEGKLRNARQLLAKDGEKNSGTMQTCVRLCHYVNDEDARRSVRLRLPNQVILDEFDADADAFRAATLYGARNARKAWTSQGALAAVHYLLHKRCGPDNPYVTAFLDGLVTGLVPGTRTVLDDIDPRAVFRTTMTDLRLKAKSRSSLTQVGMLIQTWNNCVVGRFPRYLYFNDDKPIPEILVLKPGEGVKPDAFQGVNITTIVEVQS